jgi:hypothetical protein
MTIQLMQVPGHMRTDANETADQLARQGSSPLTKPQPALDISIKVARGVIRGCMNKKHEYWQSTVDKNRLSS